MVIDMFKGLTRVFRGHTDQQAVLDDAEQLIAEWGDGAYTAAAEMSWREDSGLIYAPQPGHWDRVKQEVGQRQGWAPGEPEAVFAANLDRVWLCA